MARADFWYFYTVVCLFLVSMNICLPGAFADNPRADTVDVAAAERLKHKVHPILQSNESSLQQADSLCSRDSDCLNNGKCTTGKDGSKTCSCVNGTSGNTCEFVDDCNKIPSMCGEGADSRCEFDVEKMKAVCVCLDDRKKFDEEAESCAVPCKSFEDCGQYGDCYFETDKDYGFCDCKKGVRGDHCEIIDQCHSGKVDCGTSPRVKCALRASGKAYCKCNDTRQKFDPEIKDCRDCNCGRRAFGECSFQDGKKTCLCYSGDFYNGDECEECKCGKGGSNCASENGKKICDCYEGYYQRFDKCELCECGPDNSNCTFDEAGNKRCECPPGYVVTKDSCRQMCNSSFDCKNGGTCDQACQCSEGTSGDFCETVDWCANHRCGIYEEADCLYNRTSKEGFCRCKKHNNMWNDENRRCFECDCGVYGECIVTEKGEKVCICEKNYADSLLKCKYCYCGYGSLNCTFYSVDKRLCHCQEGFAQKTVTSWRKEDVSCERCDCGEHGRCSFNGEYKVCDCEDEYKNFNGECKECYCGPHGYCDFDEHGQKTCHCDYGYSVSPTGICRVCNCDPLEMRGIGSNCSLLSGEKNCSCPEGYEEKYSSCQDIDECNSSTSPCPANTECVNLPGTYRCDCKKGFETKFEGQDPEIDGCQDIDECQNPSACKSTTTVCVNYPGSYDCICHDGYYASSGSWGPYYNPKYVTCYKTKTQWRTASIVLGIIIAVAVLTTAVFIYNKKC